jgi:leucyl-tRNA synthetase
VPLESTVPWSTNGLVGTYRFLEKIWAISQKDFSSIQNNLLHKTIKKVTEDIESFKFNTAVSTLMIFVNEIYKEGVSKSDFKIFLQLLAPFAPHTTEELWYELGEKESIHLAPWPKYDESKIVDEELTIGVQINGKLRGEITVSKDESKESIERMALALPKVKEYTEGKSVKKIIVVPNRIINIVIAD